MSKPMTKITGIYIEDKDIVILTLPGKKYSINGVIREFTSETKIETTLDCDIRPVYVNYVIDKYYNELTGKYLTVDEYQSEYIKLKSKYTCTDEDYDEGTWTSLEDEFAFRKFVDSCVKITKQIENVGEKILFSIENIKYETGNEFIKYNYFYHCNEKPTFVKYYRKNAARYIAEEYFKKLGMNEIKDTWNNDTARKKVWSCSHDGIEYIKAFGSYVFSSNKIKNVQEYRNGTYEDMVELYEQDKLEIETIIQQKYDQHFKTIQHFDFEQHIKDLERLKLNVCSIDSKVKTQYQHQQTINSIDSIINKIMDSYEN